MLGHLRFPVAGTRGRRYPELRHPYRDEFRRDRDRIIHARAFRRLEDKTQVFASGISDHFRNRLTHTIEVAQIARTVASALELSEDLTEALALCHDFGHPPFAHAGEAELDRQMRRFNDRFDHNFHGLRIVEQFEQRYARFPGLNLTFEVREGILKHSRDIVPGEFPEFDEYLPGLRPPIEAQLIDLADEIAYNTADLDDGFAAGMFTLEDAAAAIPAYGDIRETVDGQYPGASAKVHFLETLRLLIDLLVTGLIEGTRDAAVASGAQDYEAVRSLPRAACLTPGAAECSRQLKGFLSERVYHSRPMLVERQHSAAMIAELFQHFLDDPGRMPEPYSELVSSEPPHRVVCDYIAGMTDGFFRRCYDKIHS